MDSTMKVIFTHDGHMENHSEQTKFIGVVYDDKVEEMSKDIEKHFFKNHTRFGQFPDFDLTTVPIATGGKRYLQWALGEKSKEQHKNGHVHE